MPVQRITFQEAFGNNVERFTREEVIQLQRFVFEVNDRRVVSTLKVLVLEHQVEVQTAIDSVKAFIKV